MITTMSSTTDDIDFFKNYLENFIFNKFIENKNFNENILKILITDNKILPFFFKK